LDGREEEPLPSAEVDVGQAAMAEVVEDVIPAWIVDGDAERGSGDTMGFRGHRTHLTCEAPNSRRLE